MRSLRDLELKKHPSISETLDWARTLVLLGVESIDAEQAKATLQRVAQVPKRHRPGGEGAVGGRGGRARGVAVLDVLTGFVAELRAAGLPVSLTEAIDAAEAVGHIPLEDREALKYALGVDPGQVVLALEGVRDRL